MRPYYNDPYTVEFDATVIDTRKNGDNFIVSLDNSYFYPTSGGQEHDTGSIADAEVTDVFEEDGRIFHLVSNEIPAGTVACRIDWSRRFGNMQQHTGQHILSAAFENLFGIATVSSRLGEYIGTIDLSRQPSDAEIEESVSTANRVVRENRPVAIHYAEQENIASFNLRRPPKVDGTVRIIEVKDFDMSPCGGTHCTHTSEIGVILSGNVEKVKGALARIEFFCGDRAIRRFYEIQKSARESSRLLSSSIDELPESVEKIKSQLHEKDSRIKFLSDRVLEDICEKLAPSVDSSPSVVTFTDLSSELQSTDELRFVASCVSRKTKSSFAFHRFEGNICYMNLNLAVDEKAASVILGELRSRFGVKGGGRNGFYSVTFEASNLDAIAEFVRRTLRNE